MHSCQQSLSGPETTGEHDKMSIVAIDGQLFDELLNVEESKRASEPESGHRGSSCSTSRGAWLAYFHTFTPTHQQVGH